MECLGQHVSSFSIINENLVAVNRKPPTITLNKPLAVGVSILKLSKLFMYRSYYDLFKKHFQTQLNSTQRIFHCCFQTLIHFCFRSNVKIWKMKKKN